MNYEVWEELPTEPQGKRFERIGDVRIIGYSVETWLDTLIPRFVEPRARGTVRFRSHRQAVGCGWEVYLDFVDTNGETHNLKILPSDEADSYARSLMESDIRPLIERGGIDQRTLEKLYEMEEEWEVLIPLLNDGDLIKFERYCLTQEIVPRVIPRYRVHYILRSELQKRM